MKQILSGVMALVLSSIAMPALAAPIAYTVNAQAGANRVTGTITTDGTIGVLGDANVTGYVLAIADGDTTDTIDSADGRISQVSGTALTATPDDLFFDYSAATPGTGFYFANAGFGGVFCSNADAAFACGNGAHNELAIIVAGVNHFVTRSGVQSISNAAAVTAALPEPASWGMMILGVGLVGAAARRRIRAAEAKFDDRIKRITAGEIA